MSETQPTGAELPELTKPAELQDALGKIAIEATYAEWNAKRVSLYDEYHKYHDNPTHDETKFVVVCAQLGKLNRDNSVFARKFNDSHF